MSDQNVIRIPLLPVSDPGLEGSPRSMINPLANGLSGGGGFRRKSSISNSRRRAIKGRGGRSNLMLIRKLAYASIFLLSILQFLIILWLLRSASIISDTSSKSFVNYFENSTRESDAGKCASRFIGPHGNHALDAPAFHNPRASDQQLDLCINNSTVWDGLGNELLAATVRVERGIIAEIGSSVKCKRTDRIIKGYGRLLTPGIVDMHSHEGLSTWPVLDGSDDVNESLNPVFPAGRSFDAFNPHDPSIYLSLSGGITTSLVLPGSANIIGGEAVVLKNSFKHFDVDQMRFYTHASAASTSPDSHWRWIKMAFGENTKKGGDDRNGYPETRMGSAFLMRQKLFQAKQLMTRQDIWCETAVKGTESAKIKSMREWDEMFPEDLELESLVALLRGKVKLNVHVYEAYDIEALFRISHEFNISIAAIHHATSAYLVAEKIAEEIKIGSLNENMTVAIFSDKGFYKAEAYHASVYAPLVLKHHGVPFAFKSDHSVTNAQFLPWEASKAVHFGLDPQEALMAITSVPARALGLSNRIGSVRVGMDADLVIWNGGNPLMDIGAVPARIIVDGALEFSGLDENVTSSLLISSTIPESSADFCVKLKARAYAGRENSEKSEDVNERVYIYFKNVSHLHLNETDHIKGAELIVSLSSTWADHQSELIGSNSIVECADHSGKCAQLLDGILDHNIYEVDTQGGTIIPATIAALSSLGLTEISQEPKTGAGSMTSDAWDSLTMDGGLSVLDSLNLGLGFDSSYEGAYSKMIERASRAGIGLALAVPKQSTGNIIKGMSSLFFTASNSALEGAVMQDNAAVHVVIGRGARGGSFTSISKQIDYLREVLFRAEDEWRRRRRSPDSFVDDSKKNDSETFGRTGRFATSRVGSSKMDLNAFISVLKGDLPLFVHVHKAEHIASVIRIKTEVERETPEGNFINLVVVGGSEAWKVARLIARSKGTSVLLTPVNCIPEKHDQAKCRSLSSLEHPILTNGTFVPESGIATLVKENVKFAVASESDESAHGLIWDAGWARWISDKRVDGSEADDVKGLTLHEGVGLVSWKIASMLMLGKYENIGSIDVLESNPAFLVYAGGHPLTSMTAKLIFTVHIRDYKYRKSLLRCNPVQL